MSSPAKIGFISLGCPKALVDSERILTQLRAEGYGVSPDYEQADLVIINTCGFIDSAIEESLDTIGEAIKRNGKVLVTGCLGVDSEKVLSKYPQVLGISGAHAYEDVMHQVHQQLPPPHDPYLDLLPPQGIKLTPRHYAYLKISEGCNHSCRFCIIPSLRGDLVSRPIDEVMREAENLVTAGVRELLVVSQDTSAYGVDLKYRPGFWNGRPIKTRMTELAEALSSLPAWIRMHYIYPYPHVDELIPLMAEGKILPYLDMPLQHGSREILQLMRRPAASEKVLDRIARWRDMCPDLTLRSTFIVGFPGETESHFEQLLDFISQAQLDRVGAFTYSPVQGATANELPNPVDEETKQERLQRFMAVQEEISADRLARKVGNTEIVMIDELYDDYVVARSSADAPEIDGQVIIDGAWDVEPGDFVEVKYIRSADHDLYAEMVE